MITPLPRFELPAPNGGNNNDNVPLIQFRHPAYPPATPALLVLPATDNDCDALDFDLAIAACGIVADTRPGDGYLAARLAGHEEGDLSRLDRPPDGLLRGREYFFCLEGHESSYKYPVISSFQNWRFPHGNLPPPWRDLCIPGFRNQDPTFRNTIAAKTRDITCRITGYLDAVEGAHLVPSSENAWFVSNKMNTYCRSMDQPIPVNDERNIILLRRDLHFLFDRRRFVLVPKRFASSAPSLGPPASAVELVSHVLLPSGSPELIPLYQNRTPQLVRGISPELLFARFAWSIFINEHIPFFLSSDIEYVVRLWDNAQGVVETKTISGLSVQMRSQVFMPEARSKSRSISPKKRSLSTQERQRIEEEEWLRGGGRLNSDRDLESDEYKPPWEDDEEATGSIEDEGYGADYWDVEELTRGRPRKRSWDTMADNGGDESALRVPSLSSSFSVTLADETQLPSTPGLQPLKHGSAVTDTKSAGHRDSHEVDERPRKRVNGEMVDGVAGRP